MAVASQALGPAQHLESASSSLSQAADAVALVGACSRVTSEIAAYYGYDTELPHERLYATGVLGVGLAPQASKVAAYQELNKLVQALARRKTWEVLDKNVMAQVIKRVYAAFGEKIGSRSASWPRPCPSSA